jgi:hypothetical protein
MKLVSSGVHRKLRSADGSTGGFSGNAGLGGANGKLAVIVPIVTNP